METVLVIIIVAVAAAYVGSIFYRGFKNKAGCNCGCTCCSISDSCAAPAAIDAREDASTPQADP